MLECSAHCNSIAEDKRQEDWTDVEDASARGQTGNEQNKWKSFEISQDYFRLQIFAMRERIEWQKYTAKCYLMESL